MGDDLDEVRAAYPELSCGEAAEGELSDFPYCAGKVAPERWIWFGGDPVDNINIARSPLL